MSTRAIKFLLQKGIPFEVVKYEHETKGAEFAARATGFPLERTIKTLVVNLADKQYALVLMPGDKHLDLKRLAKLCSVKRAAMADTATAERLTGYLVGGISPFDTIHKLSVLMEKSLLKLEKVLINAGQRGTMLTMSPKDIVKTLNCKVSSMVHQ
jgi:Cys-tRNA(Pro)/Cys-tRNA(Cys) deacylase